MTATLDTTNNSMSQALRLAVFATARARPIHHIHWMSTGHAISPPGDFQQHYLVCTHITTIRTGRKKHRLHLHNPLQQVRIILNNFLNMSLHTVAPRIRYDRIGGGKPLSGAGAAPVYLQSRNTRAANAFIAGSQLVPKIPSRHVIFGPCKSRTNSASEGPHHKTACYVGYHNKHRGPLSSADALSQVDSLAMCRRVRVGTMPHTEHAG